jgi:FkbM family methyltransferase
MNTKAIARFLYSSVPGLALVRFTAKDLAASNFLKPEYRGVTALSIGGGLIVDVGANRGQSVAAFKRLAPESKIVAFEPEPSSAAKLLKRYRRDPSVTIYRCALGNTERVATLFVPSYGWWNCEGMAALDREEATGWLRNPGRMLYFNEAKLTVNEYQLECKTLDSYELAPRLIKLHAQNAEFQILYGSRNTIAQHKPALMCAFPTFAITDLLSEWGYLPFSFQAGRFVPGVAQRPTTFTWYLTKSHLGGISSDQ